MRFLVLCVVGLFLMLQSCGSRKVLSESTSVNEVLTSSIGEVTKVDELQLNRAQIWELIYSLHFRADSIVTKDGTKVYKPVFETESKEVVQDEIILSSKEVGSAVNSNLMATKKSDTSSKNTFRKQFNWWGVLLPIGLLILVAVVLWKRVKGLRIL